MLHIDHFSLGVANLYEDTWGLQQETGFGHFEGGWFPGIDGLVTKVVPLGDHQYLEVESIISQRTLTDHSRWFLDQIADGDVFIGWSLRVDSLAELEEIAERRGVAIQSSQIVARFDGSGDEPHRAPDTMTSWRQGLPNVFFYGDAPHAFATDPAPHRVEPAGVEWIEVGGTAEALVEWIGPAVAELPVRFNGGPAGLYAVAVRTAEGPVVIRRRPITLG